MLSAFLKYKLKSKNYVYYHYLFSKLSIFFRLKFLDLSLFWETGPWSLSVILIHVLIVIRWICVDNNNHGVITKTGERASYQPNISDCTHAARLLSSYCPSFVSVRGQPAVIWLTIHIYIYIYTIYITYSCIIYCIYSYPISSIYITYICSTYTYEST